MFNSNGILFIPNSVTKSSLFVCLVYLIFFLLIEIFVQFSMYFFYYLYYLITILTFIDVLFLPSVKFIYIFHFDSHQSMFSFFLRVILFLIRPFRRCYLLFHTLYFSNFPPIVDFNLHGLDDKDHIWYDLHY